MLTEFLASVQTLRLPIPAINEFREESISQAKNQHSNDLAYQYHTYPHLPPEEIVLVGLVSICSRCHTI